jgi:hypothetical protein
VPVIVCPFYEMGHGIIFKLAKNIHMNWFVWLKNNLKKLNQDGFELWTGGCDCNRQQRGSLLPSVAIRWYQWCTMYDKDREQQRQRSPSVTTGTLVKGRRKQYHWREGDGKGGITGKQAQKTYRKGRGEPPFQLRCHLVLLEDAPPSTTRKSPVAGGCF